MTIGPLVGEIRSAQDGRLRGLLRARAGESHCDGRGGRALFSVPTRRACGGGPTKPGFAPLSKPSPATAIGRRCCSIAAFSPIAVAGKGSIAQLQSLRRRANPASRAKLRKPGLQRGHFIANLPPARGVCPCAIFSPGPLASSSQCRAKALLATSPQRKFQRNLDNARML